jgi:1,4-alpha-glucan branching enzyme
MWTHPGKKLLFMGGEIGQWREWNHDTALDWHLLAEGDHAGLQRWVSDLNHLYRSSPALHARDFSQDGFEWIDGNDNDNSVLTFVRRGANGELVTVACNFTPVVRSGYRMGVPIAGAWRERLNSDAPIYGGSGVGNLGRVVTEPRPWHGRPQSLALTLPPLGIVVLSPEAAQ